MVGFHVWFQVVLAGNAIAKAQPGLLGYHAFTSGTMKQRVSAGQLTEPK